MEDSLDYIESDEIVDIVKENVALQKVAVATSNYEEYGILIGDIIGIATYWTAWDDEPSSWNDMISKFPIYKLISHEWHTLSNEDPIPEVKVINI